MNIKEFFRNYGIVIAILILAATLRLWKLGEFPVHLTNDEAALGYNAFSILKTGRDEHGQILPIIFKSFGDWKPGLYVYLTVPSVLLFGLTEFAVRFPSAIMGVIAVLLVYLLVNKLFTKNLALLAALALALAPWHIHFSRGAWEANVALSMLLAAILLFLSSRAQPRFLVLSAIFFALTLWTYQSAKLASLLPLLGLVVFYRENLKVNKKFFLSALVVGLVLSVPIIISLFTGKAGRLEVMSVFSYPRPQEYIEETVLSQEDISQHGLAFQVFHSETVNFARGVVGRYFNYFSGRFLFFEGDWSNPRHTSPGSGYLLLAQIPFLIFGGLVLLARIKNRNYAFLLFWLVVAPIPAAITRDSVQGVRALNMIIPLTILIALGVERIVYSIKLQHTYIKLAVVLGIICLSIYSIILYLDSYFVQNPRKNAEDYLYGYKQTIEKIVQKTGQYESIVFDQSYDQPYIFYLFYSKYNPAIYQANSTFVEGANGDVGFVTQVDNITFRPINWSQDIQMSRVLLVGKQTAFPADKVSEGGDFSVEGIKGPDSTNLFWLISTQ